MNSVNNIKELNMEKARLKKLIVQKEAQINSQINLITEQAQPIITLVGYLGFAKKPNSIWQRIAGILQIAAPIIIGQMLSNLGVLAKTKSLLWKVLQWLVDKEVIGEEILHCFSKDPSSNTKEA